MTTLQLLTSAVAAATITLIVTGIASHIRRRRESRSLAEGLSLEIWMSTQYAKAYLQLIGEEKDFWAPAYRAPLDFAERGIAHLQGAGLLRANELQPCVRWMQSTREFNRCLDFASAAVARLGSDDAGRHYGQQETSRLKIKSTNVIELAEPAANIVANLLRSWRVRRLTKAPTAF